MDCGTIFRPEMVGGRPITIARLVRHKFVLDTQALYSILNQEHIKNENIAVISVAGAFRKGKSFLLNFMLRYLENKGRPGWMGNENEPLKGFYWRGGCEKNTVGIQVWSELFPVEVDYGGYVYVMLMDTEGLFDHTACLKDNASIFALSALLSSVQIYNVSQTIQESDLQYLELFSDFGKIIAEPDVGPPFQKLMFLVRDWSYPSDFSYGSKDGQEFVERRLAVREFHHMEQRELRWRICSSYEDVECFLMPQPGLKVSTSSRQYFIGQLKDINEEFLMQMRDFITSLFSPTTLLPKTVLNEPVTAGELFLYFEEYNDIFTSDDLPMPQTIVSASSRLNNSKSLRNALRYYDEKMNKMFNEKWLFFSFESMKKEHKDIKIDALELFAEDKKMGSIKMEDKYARKLEKALDKRLYHFWEKNCQVIRKLVILTFEKIHIPVFVILFFLAWNVRS